MAPISRDQLRVLLRGSDLLGKIPENEIETLAARVRRVSCPRGRIIFMKEDEGTEVMFVASGRVKIVSTSPSGTEVIHNIIESGQVFGEIALLDGKPRSADAIAAEDSEIIELSRHDFRQVLLRNPETGLRMMEILCGRIRQSTFFVENAVLLNSNARLLNQIRTLAEQYGEPLSPGKKGAAQEAIKIRHKLSQQEIGESVGLTRVSINRILSQWRADGLIEDGRGYLTVFDFNRLEKAVLQTKN